MTDSFDTSLAPGPRYQESKWIWLFFVFLAPAVAFGISLLAMQLAETADIQLPRRILELPTAAFVGALLGFWAARKNRNPWPWALGGGLPALLLGLIPLIIGALIIAFLPKEPGQRQGTPTAPADPDSTRLGSTDRFEPPSSLRPSD